MAEKLTSVCVGGLRFVFSDCFNLTSINRRKQEMYYHKMMVSRRGCDDYLDTLYEVAVNDTEAQIQAEIRRREYEREKAKREERYALNAKCF